MRLLLLLIFLCTLTQINHVVRVQSLPTAFSLRVSEDGAPALQKTSMPKLQTVLDLPISLAG